MSPRPALQPHERGPILSHAVQSSRFPCSLSSQPPINSASSLRAASGPGALVGQVVISELTLGDLQVTSAPQTGSPTGSNPKLELGSCSSGWEVGEGGGHSFGQPPQP